MKKSIFCLVLALACAWSEAYAEDCRMEVRLQNPDISRSEMPEEMTALINRQLQRTLKSLNLTASEEYGQIYLSTSLEDGYKEAPLEKDKPWIVNATIRVDVTEPEGKRPYASKSFQLRGTGPTEEQAYMAAIRSLEREGSALRQFMNDAGKRTLVYFNANYKAILAKAKKLAEREEYPKALYHTTLIPVCSKGYPAAREASLLYLRKYREKSAREAKKKGSAKEAPKDASRLKESEEDMLREALDIGKKSIAGEEGEQKN